MAVGSPEDVVGVEIAMMDVAGVEMLNCGSDTAGNGECCGRRQHQAGRINIPGAAFKAGRPGQGFILGIDQIHDQSLRLSWVLSHTAQNGIEMGMRSDRDGGCHFGGGQAVAGHAAFEDFDRHSSLVLPPRAVDRAGSAFPELGFDLQFLPRDFTGQCGRGDGLGQRVACEREPTEPWHLEKPFRESGKVVGGNAQEFELGAFGQAFRQFGQAIAGEHELLQERALAEGLGKLLQTVVREDEPAQSPGQRLRRDGLNLIGLKADHAELRAVAKHGRQMIERVVGAEQDAELGQASEVVWQGAQLIATEVEDLQGIGQVEDLARKLGQPALEVQAGDAIEQALAESGQGVHGRAVRGL